MSADISFPAPQPDKISGPSTTELAGTVVEYRYSTGNHYRMEFDAESLSFDHLVPAGPTIGPLPYRARRLRDDLFLVCWIIKPGVHVALIMDFASRQIHVTAMMPPNQWEFFDIAEVLYVRPDPVKLTCGHGEAR